MRSFLLLSPALLLIKTVFFKAGQSSRLSLRRLPATPPSLIGPSTPEQSPRASLRQPEALRGRSSSQPWLRLSQTRLPALQVLRTLSGQAVAVSVSSADLQILKSLSASVDSLSSSTSSLSLGLSLSSSVIAQSGHSGSLAGEPQTVDNFIATFEDSQVFSASVSM